MKQKSRRMIRVGEEIRHALSEIMRRDLADPALELASISEVDVASDLSKARVYVSSLGEDESRSKAADRLNELQGRVRHLLSQRVRLRHTPELVFLPDDTAAHAAQINQILQDVLPRKSETEDEEE